MINSKKQLLLFVLGIVLILCIGQVKGDEFDELYRGPHPHPEKCHEKEKCEIKCNTGRGCEAIPIKCNTGNDQHHHNKGCNDDPCQTIPLRCNTGNSGGPIHTGTGGTTRRPSSGSSVFPTLGTTHPHTGTTIASTIASTTASTTASTVGTSSTVGTTAV
ncbi:hypothetical protein DFA_11273 [Cavenderia fasciculata]|uniref:Uncharacterized protein n=1 Tax=Cavenderia fasciculata TaxID=261658 RepID=F4QC25_CACFS|nr:uncharacterized protein DFA_11273 [Cavenderia fasciculata]EGG13512.1 hypothetical protein DFA_11273 [Cavenderia fasciculata]|eukprot:XP_004350216.1 hypothetical protein DFA_11273 [Cavenderia fasciculata]